MCTDTPHNVHGFKVVGLKYDNESKGVHQLLWKPHRVKMYSEYKPAECTLFVVNVPPYCTTEVFQRLFSVYGKVKWVFFHKKPSSGPPPTTKYPLISPLPVVTGFKVAYVVFIDPSGLKAAMSVPAHTVLVASSSSPLTGINKWQAEYNDGMLESTVRKEVKDLMEEYDRKTQAEKEAAGKLEADEDGWVTVTSTKKKKPRLAKVGELKNTKSKKRKNKKKQELVNFYAFQTRQARMDNLAQLRKKFDEDKKRITQMKASRKFRPY
ncbi:hypothetical protein Pcinc_014775 [Petrolisthes cinctipes]|uniref:Ribosomal RNA-processing protein 7 C-terminal domain-containing protein n=1 Tax=Petrolisthes cinctipes TaxID=88211 RepID=A0AAE1KRG9_PETCI|nr:hypothetical protein Pcinc_034208 [Petrolisthes cinctipes]KAK3880762.1 hypothetical protein Pcinc_014775 [Petrolisthes cinctipes]